MATYTEENLSRSGSVTDVREDMQDIPLLRFFMPSWTNGSRKLLPSILPAETQHDYYSRRQEILLSTVMFEEEWSSVVGKATNKMGSKDWEVSSKTPLRAKRLKELLNRACGGLGFVGWNAFVQSSVASFILVGVSYIEIQRAPDGRVFNLRCLNPLRCRMRNDPWKPIAYLPEDGGDEILMDRRNVWIISDQPAPTQGDGDGQIVASAAQRAYNSIVRMNALGWYMTEKIKGDQPLSVFFLGGATRRIVDDGMKMASIDADAKSRTTYRGAAVIPVPTETSISLVEVPFSSLPEKFDITEERQAAQLVYARSLGLDPQEVNPALLASGSMGTGTQSKVLADKARGNAMASWAKQITHCINSLDPVVTFQFDEDDLDDRLMEAKIALAEAEAMERIQLVTGLTQEECLAIFVRKGIVPAEYQYRENSSQQTYEDDVNEGAMPEMRSEPRPEPDVVSPSAPEGDPAPEDSRRRDLARGRTRLAPELGRSARREKQDNFFHATKTVAEDVMESAMADSFAQIVADIITRQIDQANLDLMVRITDELDSAQDIAKAIDPIIPPFQPTPDEIKQLEDMMTQAGIDALDDPAGDDEASIREYARDRLEVLFGSGSVPSDEEPPPFIGNPNLPSEDGLNPAYWIALAILASRSVTDEGVDSEVISVALAVILSERMEDKSEGIAWELARMTGVAWWLYGRRRGAVSKEWLRTSSPNPRESHLATVGEIVPFESRFSNGEYWSNQVPNCKCGIRLIFNR